VIPTLLIKSRELVKGKSFGSWRRVGVPIQAVRIHEMRQVDELIILYVDGLDIEHAAMLADECYMPVTIGGGIRTIEDIRRLLAAGADKISINTAAVENPAFITQAAMKFGRQCVVVSIDVQEGMVVTRSGKNPTHMKAVDWAVECEGLGAGEILLGNVRRDGTMDGYDSESLQKVSAAVGVPIIASGGARNADDMAGAINAGASAVAAGALFQFTQTTPMDVKSHMKQCGIPVRDSQFISCATRSKH
jgi:cyclase